MTILEGRTESVADEEPGPPASSIEDVVAPHLVGRILAPGEEIVLLHQEYWRNPASRARVSAQRLELALTKMGEHHPGFGLLVRAGWTEVHTETGALEKSRCSGVRYMETDLVLQQMQRYNSFGRLIVERVNLWMPEPGRIVG